MLIDRFDSKTRSDGVCSGCGRSPLIADGERAPTNRGGPASPYGADSRHCSDDRVRGPPAPSVRLGDEPRLTRRQRTRSHTRDPSQRQRQRHRLLTAVVCPVPRRAGSSLLS